MRPGETSVGRSGVMAFVDESQPDAGSYLLCAAIGRGPELIPARSAMGRMRPRTGKAHWHGSADPRRRRALTAAVMNTQLDVLLIVLRDQLGSRSERRRRLCVERLCHELVMRSADAMVFESRGAADDRRDRIHLDTLRARKVVPGSLRLDHVPGPAEPLLWIPDIVCGAFNAERRGDPIHFAAVSSAVTLIEI